MFPQYKVFSLPKKMDRISSLAGYPASIMTGIWWDDKSSIWREQLSSLLYIHITGIRPYIWPNIQYPAGYQIWYPVWLFIVLNTKAVYLAILISDLSLLSTAEVLDVWIRVKHVKGIIGIGCVKCTLAITQGI